MTQRLLMCPPEYFNVHYSINPWMNGQIGKVRPDIAREQWNDLFESLKELAQVDLLTAQPQVPDLVFTANAGLPIGNKFIPSRFRFNPRRLEEPYFHSWFQNHGFEILESPPSLCFEGVGDALFQPDQDLLWVGHGFRTDPEIQEFLRPRISGQVILLKLVDPIFYHLDTCFCPLPKNRVMYYPGAFDGESLEKIENQIPKENHIAVSQADALQLVCNSVLIGDTLVMPFAGRNLKTRLKTAGFSVLIKSVGEFIKAGGAAKCLTMALPWLREEKNSGVKHAA